MPNVQGSQFPGTGRPLTTDVYIGRPSPWGNPFSSKLSKLAVERVASKDDAIAQYEVWIQTQPNLLAMLPDLKGKVLGCFCKPGRCHGDILAKLADLAPDPVHPF